MSLEFRACVALEPSVLTAVLPGRLGRHLASILAHSLALCADPPPLTPTPPPVAPILSRPSPSRNTLPMIIASPLTSPGSSRQTSISDAPLDPSSPVLTSDTPPYTPLGPTTSASAASPVLSESKRFKLITNLQLWTFNPMDYTPDELLSCVGLIFESVRSMEGVEFDQGASPFVSHPS